MSGDASHVERCREHQRRVRNGLSPQRKILMRVEWENLRTEDFAHGRCLRTYNYIPRVANVPCDGIPYREVFEAT